MEPIDPAKLAMFVVTGLVTGAVMGDLVGLIYGATTGFGVYLWWRNQQDWF